jgi:HEAT repeat protein
MVRALGFVLLLLTLPLAAPAIQAPVHPTERDEILKMISALGSASEDTVERAREALLEKGDKAVPFLLEALKHDASEPIRMDVAALLGELRDESALTPLFVASQVDTSPRVRMAAQLALEHLTADLGERRTEDTRWRDYEKVTQKTITELKNHLKNDADEEVRARAARSLGIYGSEDELDFLYDRARRDKVPRVRVACFNAIRRLTYPIVLAQDFQALSSTPIRRPRNPIAVLTTKRMIERFRDEEDPAVRVAIVENLTECVYPIFLLGERRFRGGRGSTDDHAWIIEAVTDEFRHDLEKTEDAGTKRAEITAVIRLLSAYYRVGDADLHEEIRRRLTSEFRRQYLDTTSDGSSILIRVRFDRYYRTRPPKNDKMAERVADVLGQLYLEDGDWQIRRLSVEGIGLFGDKSDSVTVIKGLSHEQNLDVWESAIRALGLLDKATSATYLLGLYQSSKVPDRLRAAAALSIGMIHYPQETRRLAALLAQEPSLDVRLAAIEALSFNRDATTARTLVGQLRHDEPRVRAAALEALRYNPDKDAASLVESLLLTDTDAAVRAAAAPTLAILARQAAVPGLTRALRDDSRDVRRAAAIELGLLEAADALEPLIAVATTDPDPDVRLEAALSLGDIGDIRAIEPLVRRVLIEEQLDNRRAIYEALLAMRKPSSVIVSIWGKLPPLQQQNPTLYEELQELLVYLQEQSKGHTVDFPG